jgi:hypothetical protein
LLGDIALVFTAIGVLGATFGVWQSYRARIAQFEEKYVHRYWQLLDQLSLDALRGRVAEPAGMCEGDEKAIRSYFYLCEDELEMRKNGYISDATCGLWSTSIKQQLEQAMFAKVWAQLQQGEASFPFDNLGKLIDTRNYDPLTLPTVARITRGLRDLRPARLNPNTSTINSSVSEVEPT